MKRLRDGDKVSRPRREPLLIRVPNPNFVRNLEDLPSTHQELIRPPKKRRIVAPNVNAASSSRVPDASVSTSVQSELLQARTAREKKNERDRQRNERIRQLGEELKIYASPRERWQEALEADLESEPALNEDEEGEHEGETLRESVLWTKINEMEDIDDIEVKHSSKAKSFREHVRRCPPWEPAKDPHSTVKRFEFHMDHGSQLPSVEIMSYLDHLFSKLHESRPHLKNIFHYSSLLVLGIAVEEFIKYTTNPSNPHYEPNEEHHLDQSSSDESDTADAMEIIGRPEPAWSEYVPDDGFFFEKHPEVLSRDEPLSDVPVRRGRPRPQPRPHRDIRDMEEDDEMYPRYALPLWFQDSHQEGVRAEESSEDLLPLPDESKEDSELLPDEDFSGFT